MAGWLLYSRWPKKALALAEQVGFVRQKTAWHLSGWAADFARPSWPFAKLDQLAFLLGQSTVERREGRFGHKFPVLDCAGIFMSVWLQIYITQLYTLIYESDQIWMRMVDSGDVCLHDHWDYGRTETESWKHRVKRLVLHVVATFCPWTLASPEINIPVGRFTWSQKIKHGGFCMQTPILCWKPGWPFWGLNEGHSLVPLSLNVTPGSQVRGVKKNPGFIQDHGTTQNPQTWRGVRSPPA